MFQYWHFTESESQDATRSPFLELDLLFSGTLAERWIGSLQMNGRWDTHDLDMHGGPIAGSRGHAYAIGPKLSYVLDANTMLSLTWLHDVEVSNQLEGDWIYGRIARGF